MTLYSAKRLWWLAVIIGSCLLLMTTVGIMGSWYVRGGRLLSVQSGSMAPTFIVGDGVVVTPMPVNLLRVGDIIAYKNRSQPAVITTHRLVARNALTGTLTTKGDALALVDGAVLPSQVIGRVTARAPYFGRVSHWLRSPVIVITLAYVPLMGLIVYELRRLSSLSPALRRAVSR